MRKPKYIKIPGRPGLYQCTKCGRKIPRGKFQEHTGGHRADKYIQDSRSFQVQLKTSDPW